MEKIVELPQGVNARMDGRCLILAGPLGECRKDFSKMTSTHIAVEDNQIKLACDFSGKKEKMVLHTAEAHVKNMILGVTAGFRFVVDVISVHFPIRVAVVGDEVTISNFIGGKSDVKFKKRSDVKMEVASGGKQVVLTGTNLESVSLMAARLEQATKKRLRNKDRRVFKDGLYISKRGYMNE
ncbi:MAG TPA: 50S ribosomal protein L6 [archaeon]|nr:50S ribosomal protein L6 [archaeon]